MALNENLSDDRRDFLTRRRPPDEAPAPGRNPAGSPTRHGRPGAVVASTQAALAAARI